ncbi:MAG: uroporphyrinogen-III synthase [bacterium]
MVTRAREQARGMCRALERQGAEVVEMPTIKIVPVEDKSGLDASIESIADYDILVFTSANGVKHFFDRMKKLGKSMKGVKIRIMAVGEKTGAALRRRKVKTEAGPKDFTGEDLAEKLIEEGVKGKKILMHRADIATDDVPRALRRAGAKVSDVTAYRTVTDDSERGEALRLLSLGKVDCITFTSASNVRNFLKKTTNVSPSLYRNAVIACIGPVTVKQAVALGIPVDVVPGKFTAEELAVAVADYFAKKKSGGGK